MVDQGHSRNAVYNIDALNIPDVSKTVYSKALGIHDSGTTNQTFFSFGSRNTNFRKHMMKTSDGRQLNTTMASLKKQFNKMKKMTDTDSTVSSYWKPRIGQPNCLMNDYTKNISQSIFNPGELRPDMVKDLLRP